MSIGWKFPSTDGGDEHGFNESGIEYFTGKKFSSVAREIIQNSLDAKDKPSLDAVQVVFRTEDIKSEDFPGRGEFLDIFEKCAKKAKNDKEEKAERFFKNGLTLLKKPTIKFLHIADYNTTGLLTKPPIDTWRYLTKAKGLSGKDATAGGSFGIGKYAPYAVSGLRTVFYATKCRDKSSFVHKAQGRAVLISHNDKKGLTQGTGFYGEKQNCEPIPKGQIPNFMLRQEQGTTVSIAGFNDSENWGDRIAAAVIANFFVAINNKHLRVSIDCIPDEINADTLAYHFERLLDIYKKDNKEDFADIGLAHEMYRALLDGEERDFQLRKGLRHWKLKILIGDGLSQKVGIVRNTGMLITSDLNGLIRFPGMGDFTAICICDTDEGNKLLRIMEPPTHDDFQPGRLEGAKEQSQGRAALVELAQTIRDRIKKLVISDDSDSAAVEEMGKFFPDPDKAEGDEENGPDRDFEGGLSITKKKKISPKILQEEDDGTDDDENGSDHEVEREQSEKSGGNNGNDDDKKTYRSVLIKKIRVTRQKDEHKVIFTSNESCTVRLRFWIAGDTQVHTLELDEESKQNAEIVHVTKGKRSSFTFKTMDNTASDAAIRVEAQAKIEKEKT